MNFYSSPHQNKPECPEDLLTKEEEHEDQQPLNLEEFRRLALEVKFLIKLKTFLIF